MITDTLLAQLPVLAAALLGLLGGYAVGARRSRRSRRTLQRDLGVRSIELLEARAGEARLAAKLADEPRRERLLRLALGRLSEARARERRAFVERSRLHLAAVQNAARARRAASLARAAAARCAALEESAEATGTITTCAPKSYGSGEPVTVSVVDRETPTARRDNASRVPHRERARFAQLAPSNETRRLGSGELDLIDGLASADAHRLRALGIRDLEQLAALSDGEQRRLQERLAEDSGPRPLGAWIGGARALLERRSPV